MQTATHSLQHGRHNQPLLHVPNPEQAPLPFPSAARLHGEHVLHPVLQLGDFQAELRSAGGRSRAKRPRRSNRGGSHLIHSHTGACETGRRDRCARKSEVSGLGLYIDAGGQRRLVCRAERAGWGNARWARCAAGHEQTGDQNPRQAAHACVQRLPFAGLSQVSTTSPSPGAAFRLVGAVGGSCAQPALPGIRRTSWACKREATRGHRTQAKAVQSSRAVPRTRWHILQLYFKPLQHASHPYLCWWHRHCRCHQRSHQRRQTTALGASSSPHGKLMPQC